MSLCLVNYQYHVFAISLFLDVAMAMPYDLILQAGFVDRLINPGRVVRNPVNANPAED